MSGTYKILVADDSTSIRNSIKHILMENPENKYQVLLANNGREACSMAFLEKPDLILIDLSMPVMDGIEAIHKIKSNQQIKMIPIIAISSTSRFQEAFSVGAVDFLLKPFVKFELLTRVNLNLMLAEKSYEIKQQHEILKSQREEAINQRDIISKQKQDLIDDLQYARFVQNAILPSHEVLNNLFSDYFVYDQPRNLVSGDFFWVARKNGKKILAVGDCTGHGMSGALMTMAGTAFLNEIVRNSEDFNTDSILNELRKRVIKLLNQKGTIGEASNGMDIALCIFDEPNNNLEFSGANNPLYYVRNEGTFEIIKGDRMPIGYYFDNELTFTRNELHISKGDTIYLFSDGYADQFGGPLGKKFRYNQFRELIANASTYSSMEQQIELIRTTMNEWIEGYEQLDDMLVMGVKW